MNEIKAEILTDKDQNTEYVSFINFPESVSSEEQRNLLYQQLLTGLEVNIERVEHGKRTILRVRYTLKSTDNKSVIIIAVQNKDIAKVQCLKSTTYQERFAYDMDKGYIRENSNINRLQYENKGIIKLGTSFLLVSLYVEGINNLEGGMKTINETSYQARMRSPEILGLNFTTSRRNQDEDDSNSTVITTVTTN